MLDLEFIVKQQGQRYFWQSIFNYTLNWNNIKLCCYLSELSSARKINHYHSKAAWHQKALSPSLAFTCVHTLIYINFLTFQFIFLKLTYRRPTTNHHSTCALVAMVADFRAWCWICTKWGGAVLQRGTSSALLLLSVVTDLTFTVKNTVTVREQPYH